MGADVADGGAEPRSRRIQAPLGLLLDELLVRHHEKILQVLDNNLPHFPHCTRAKKSARVSDESVAGVIVRDREDEPSLLDQLR
jgi:hypothetical protein